MGTIDLKLIGILLKDHAGISEEEFFNYFSNSEMGFALEIKDVEKF